MAATFNLKRNSRVLITTNLSSTSQPNQVASSGFTPANTQELTILDNFSFTQATTAQAITISEGGATPVRGQRSFNTALNPVDFSFSTYIRPFSASGVISADEEQLWTALLGTNDGTTGNITFTGSTATATLTTAGALSVVGTSLPIVPLDTIYTFAGIGGTNASELNTQIKFSASSATTLVGQFLTAPNTTAMTIAATATLSLASWNANVAVAADTLVGNTAYAEVTSARSNFNQLLPFGLVITVDGVTYTIDNCVLEQATVDFGLTGIAMVAWTGKGTALNPLTTNVTYSSASNPVLSGGLTGTVTGKSSVASTKFIVNKLSTIGITSNIGGSAGTAYTLAITGGSLQISNNITFLTPANLGVVNTPIGYFTGTRAITGTVTAYLRTGSTNTAGLLKDMLTGSATNAETKFKLAVNIGGANTTRVETLINGASLTIPTVDASQDVLSTSIAFTAQAYDAQMTSTSGYDIEGTNDLRIRYFTT